MEKEFTIRLPYYLVDYIEHALDFICNINIGISNIHIKQVKRETAYYIHLKITMIGTNKDIMDKVYNTILAENETTML